MRIKLHRNSQKRFYGQKIYFITTVTENRYPYFMEPLFCKILWDDIFYAQKIKKFTLYGFVIIHNHLHILLKTKNEYNISQIIQSLKTNSSRNINKIIKHKNLEGEMTSSRLPIHDKKNRPFKWQQSFHDHIIRDLLDFRRHINYLKINPKKHGITKNKKNYQWLYINKKT